MAQESSDRTNIAIVATILRWPNGRGVGCCRFPNTFMTFVGERLDPDDLVVILSMRLDESGTDGISPFTVVGGAVSDKDGWAKLETAWGNLLRRSKVSAYHCKEFNDRKDNFAGWSDFKCKRFVKFQENIICEHTLFRVSVGVEGSLHTDIKKRMKGTKGFREDSNYGLCLRRLMYAACERVEGKYPDHRLTVMVEDGPWSSGAINIYQDVARMTGKWNPAKHAHRLAGFMSVPKGERLSLEAADYIAGAEHARFLAGESNRQESGKLSLLLNAEELERWYEGMIKAKEIRRAHWERQTDDA